MAPRRNQPATSLAFVAEPDVQETAQRAHGNWRRVAESLQTEIIFGRLYPRERLVEDNLMSRFDSSRHAVRMAIDELVRQGLVVREANRGASVRAFSGEEVEDLFEVQGVLERHAIQRMPLPVSADVLERLNVLQTAHERAGTDMQALEICRWNREFHDTLFAACGNAELAEAIRGYSLLTDPIRMRRIPDPGWRKQAVADHRKMVQMLAKCDRAGLAMVCTQHIEPTKEYFLRTLASFPQEPEITT